MASLKLFIAAIFCALFLISDTTSQSFGDDEVYFPHISSVLDYLNANPNKVYNYKRGSLLSAQNKADIVEISAEIEVECNHQFPDIPCSERTLICHAFVGKSLTQHDAYQVLSDVRCSPKIEITVEQDDTSNVAPMVFAEQAMDGGKLDLSNEAMSPDQGNADFVAIRKENAPCLGCPFDLNKDAEGVDELIDTAVKHIESERGQRHKIINVRRLQQQVIAGLKYILLADVAQTTCPKDADLSAPCSMDTSVEPFVCEVIFIEKPWISKSKHIVKNNCTVSQEFEPLSRPGRDRNDISNEILPHKDLDRPTPDINPKPVIPNYDDMANNGNMDGPLDSSRLTELESQILLGDVYEPSVKIESPKNMAPLQAVHNQYRPVDEPAFYTTDMDSLQVEPLNKPTPDLTTLYISMPVMDEVDPVVIMYTPQNDEYVMPPNQNYLPNIRTTDDIFQYDSYLPYDRYTRKSKSDSSSESESESSEENKKDTNKHETSTPANTTPTKQTSEGTPEAENEPEVTTASPIVDDQKNSTRRKRDIEQDLEEDFVSQEVLEEHERFKRSSSSSSSSDSSSSSESHEKSHKKRKCRKGSDSDSDDKCDSDSSDSDDSSSKYRKHRKHDSSDSSDDSDSSSSEEKHNKKHRKNDSSDSDDSSDEEKSKKKKCHKHSSCSDNSSDDDSNEKDKNDKCKKDKKCKNNDSSDETSEEKDNKCDKDSKDKKCKKDETTEKPDSNSSDDNCPLKGGKKECDKGQTEEPDPTTQEPSVAPQIKTKNKRDDDRFSTYYNKFKKSSKEDNNVRATRSVGQMEKISPEEKSVVRDLADFAVATLDAKDDDHHLTLILQILGAKKLKLDGIYYQIILRLGISHCREYEYYENCREKLFTNLTKICKVQIHVEDDYTLPRLVKSQCQNIKKDENDRNRTNYSRYRRELLVGGHSAISTSEPFIQEIVNTALAHLDSVSDQPNKHTNVEVVSATSQVVAGINYVVTTKIGISNCKKSEQDDAKLCSLLADTEPQTCTISVWDRSWLNTTIYTIKCGENKYEFTGDLKNSRRKRDLDLGSDEHVHKTNDPQVLTMVRKALEYLSTKTEPGKTFRLMNLTEVYHRVVPEFQFFRIEAKIALCEQSLLSPSIHFTMPKCPHSSEHVTCEFRALKDNNILDDLKMNITCDNDDQVYVYEPIKKADNRLGSDQALHASFRQFAVKYNKIYNDETEYNFRVKVFRDNLNKISLLNKYEKGTARYGITPFADLTEKEFSQGHGYRPDLRNENELPFASAKIPNIDLPSEIDWRTKGAVTEVKNQGSCGSCWAFSTTGNVEGQYAIKYGKLLEFSEQELVDCDKVDQGCGGGLMDNAYRVIEKLGGLESESDYPYDGSDDTCKFSANKVKVQLSGALNISHDETDMAKWLAQNGPISIAINANAMQFYFGGVSHPWKFLCSPSNLDHGVLIVGYGEHKYNLFNKTLPYWIVKNSWGTSWGEQGYYRVYRGDGTCGLNQTPSSAIVA